MASLAIAVAALPTTGTIDSAGVARAPYRESCCRTRAPALVFSGTAARIAPSSSVTTASGPDNAHGLIQVTPHRSGLRPATIIRIVLVLPLPHGPTNPTTVLLGREPIWSSRATARDTNGPRPNRSSPGSSIGSSTHQLSSGKPDTTIRQPPPKPRPAYRTDAPTTHLTQDHMHGSAADRAS